MTFIKNKTFWVMLFVVLIGTILRLIFIDKPEGLWNDEYLSWHISSIPLGKNFVNAIISQCHMPLYYLYLKIFIHFLGNSDLMLRYTSVLTGILSIISMYFVGKEAKDNKLGILCASIASLSSFLIYFSQEVRIYGILFLFSSISLLFTLKLLNNQTAKNAIFYTISNLLIIFTHTIGFVFVFLNLVFVTVSLREKYKKALIIIWSLLFIFGLTLAPHIIKIFTEKTYSQWWGHFSLSKIGFLITDYFSPILTNIVSSPDNFFYNFSLKFILFALLPSIIAIIGIIKALKSKESKILGLFFVSISFILILTAMSISGKLVFLTKYSMEIYPILIALMGYGLLKFNNNWRYILIFIFSFLNLFYIIASHNSAPKMHRSEGHKIVANLLKNSDLHYGDIIILNYYPKDRFEKYFNFSNYRVLSINKGNFNTYLGTISEYKTRTNGKELYKKVFSSSENPYFDAKFKHEVVDALMPNQKVVIVILNDVAIYSPMQIQKITSTENLYKKAPFLFLAFSYIKNEFINDSLTKLQITRFEQKGSWSVFTFKKQ